MGTITKTLAPVRYVWPLTLLLASSAPAQTTALIGGTVIDGTFDAR
jgi:hypothetical protein